MKNRMTAVDIRALCIILSKKLKGLRMANVYDITNKTYIFKMAAGGKKELLLIESGI